MLFTRHGRLALRARSLQSQTQLRKAFSSAPPPPPPSAAQTAAVAAANNAGAKPQESDFTRYAGMAVFSAIVATTAYLGSWQTQRYFWKVNLVEERERELHEPAVELPLDASANSSVDDIEYRQLRVTGTFKPNSTFYLFPRSAPAESTDNVATPKSGGYIYSLLERPNATPVIVNRGWLPRKLLDQHMARNTAEETGVVSFVGVLRHGEEKSTFTPDNDVARRQFFYLQHDELAHAMGVDDSNAQLPVILDALVDDNDDNAPLTEPSLDHLVRKQLHNYMAFYMTPEKHAAYAATWFSFSVAAAVLAVVRFKKSNRVMTVVKSK